MSHEDPDLQQQKETTLMALFQAISVSLLVLKQDYTIWMINANAAAWLDKNPQDLEGQPLWKFLSPGEFLSIDRHLQQVLQTRQTVFFRGTHQQREYGHTFFPILDASGSVVYLALTGRDISEYVRLERDLLEGRQALQNALDGTRAGLWDWHIASGAISFNERWAEIAGYTLEELQPVDIQTWNRLCHPDDLQNSDLLLQRLFRHEEEHYHCHCRIRHKNGEWVWVADSGKIVEWSEDGKPLRMIGTHIDITEEKRREDALFFRSSILDQISDMVATTDLCGNITYINQAQIDYAGCSATAMVGQPLERLTASFVNPPSWEQILSQTLEKGKWQSELVRRDSAAGPKILECNTQILHDAQGNPSGICCIMKDVSERKQAEEELHRKTDELDIYFTSSLDLLCIADNEGYFRRLNPEWERTLGYSLSELEGRSFFSLIHPEDLETTHAAVNRLKQQNPVLSFENRYRTKNGDYRWIEWRSFPAGNTIYAAARDITARKAVEESLRNRQQQFYSLFHNMQEGVALHEVIFGDGEQVINYRIIEVNPKYEQIVGIPTADISGKLATEVYGVQAPPYLKEFSDVALLGVPSQLEVYFQPLDKNFSISIAPWGKNGFATIFSDVSERVRNERALRESEERFRTYINEAPDGVFILDGEGLCQEANPSLCNMLGFTYQEMKSMSLGDICVEKHAAKGQAFLEQLRNANRRNDELVFTRKDGRKIDVWIDAVRLPNGHLMAFCHDITERKHLEERLQEAQKMEAIGRLAGGIAHDFNNLLQVINGNADMAMQELLPDNPAYGLMEEVHKAGMRAAKLVGQLLAFSRRQVIRPDLLHLNDVISGLLKMLNRILGEHIQIEFHPDPALGVILADRIQIEQILLNLCANARDAMPEGGLLTLETCNLTMDSDFCTLHKWAKIGSYVFLRIADNGCGMNTDTLEHLWEPFFTTKDISKGTGLGLATVYGVVRQHEGIINVYSELGKGTEFKIYFPRAEAKSCEKEIPAGALPESGTENILVAEDEDMVRNLTRRILENAGYTVWTAGNGRDAVTLCDSLGDKIDLALLDVVMPGMGGRAVYERLKVKFPKMRFLFASGYNINAIHTNFVLEEGFELIEKPFSRQQLLSIVRRILDS